MDTVYTLQELRENFLLTDKDEKKWSFENKQNGKKIEGSVIWFKIYCQIKPQKLFIEMNDLTPIDITGPFPSRFNKNQQHYQLKIALTKEQSHDLDTFLYGPTITLLAMDEIYIPNKDELVGEIGVRHRNLKIDVIKINVIKSAIFEVSDICVRSRNKKAPTLNFRMIFHKIYT